MLSLFPCRQSCMRCWLIRASSFYRNRYVNITPNKINENSLKSSKTQSIFIFPRFPQSLCCSESKQGAVFALVVLSLHLFCSTTRFLPLLLFLLLFKSYGIDLSVRFRFWFCREVPHQRFDWLLPCAVISLALILLGLFLAEKILAEFFSLKVNNTHTQVAKWIRLLGTIISLLCHLELDLLLYHSIYINVISYCTRHCAGLWECRTNMRGGDVGWLRKTWTFSWWNLTVVSLKAPIKKTPVLGSHSTFIKPIKI